MADGCIEKRGPNAWRIGTQVKTDTGEWKWVRRPLRFPPGMSEAQQYKECKKSLRQLMVDVDAGVVKPITYAQTVRSFSTLWMEQHVIPNTKPNTVKTYQSFLDARILPALGDIPLKQLTPLMLTEFINSLRSDTRRTSRLPVEQLKHGHRHPSDLDKMTDNPKKPLAARTVQHYHDALDAMLDKAVQWKLIPTNPMHDVDRPKAPKSRAHWLTEEQAVDLLRCLAGVENISYRAAVLLALLCGLRLGEVDALMLSDVDWKNGTIDISRALTYTPTQGNFEDTPKTEAGSRLITLPAGMMAVLHEAREYQRETAALIGELWVGAGHIVHSWNGARLSHDTVSKWFRKFAREHGFENVTFHQLRHTHATILLANNIDAVAVATRLGHADATVTLRTYAHALRRRDVEAALAAQHIVDLAALDAATPEPPDTPDPSNE